VVCSEAGKITHVGLQRSMPFYSRICKPGAAVRGSSRPMRLPDATARVKGGDVAIWGSFTHIVAHWLEAGDGRCCRRLSARMRKVHAGRWARACGCYSAKLGDTAAPAVEAERIRCVVSCGPGVPSRRLGCCAAGTRSPPKCSHANGVIICSYAQPQHWNCEPSIGFYATGQPSAQQFSGRAM
jgi:hypothetical protein